VAHVREGDQPLERGHVSVTVPTPQMSCGEDRAVKSSLHRVQPCCVG
jgi:hypothetical protein